jgi:hypothetical protein
MPCRQFAVKGKKRCRLHGAFNGGWQRPKWTPLQRQLRKRAQVEESDRLYDLWLAKQRRPKVAPWPTSRPTMTMEEQFRQGGRGQGRKRDGWTPY